MNPEIRLSGVERQSVEEFRKQHRTAMLALVFTDVERSTALRNEMGELPASALMARHNEVIRGALAGFVEAQEISTAGDSFFLVFAKPSDAVRYALLAQSRLCGLAAEIRPDFRVRMGIHLGEVAVAETASGGPMQDVLGMQVDLAARVTALAAGGQILMTRGVFDNARQILKGQSLPGVGELSWLSHGPYLLKGFDEPLAICEVGETGAAPLRQPDDCAVAKRAVVPGTEPVLGWRPAVEQVVPGTEWELEKKLGEGGFGEVWLARHRRSKELRVFKFCFRADRLRSLKREMTLFRVLKEILGERPDIARLYEIQFEEPPYYLEFEYTSGGDLSGWIEARGGFDAVPMELRLELVAQTATALAAAHSVGVIHRDVKPSNVLIEERKGGTGILPVEGAPPVQVRLTDFGIGELVDRQALERAGITATGFTETVGAMTELSSRTGTRLYMAPELVAGRPPTIQSDIYSLGVLLYQLIIGDLSQPMITDWERQVRDPLLRDDLRRCLAGNPSKRFPSASDLSHRLRTLSRRRRRRHWLAYGIPSLLATYLLFLLLALADRSGIIPPVRHPGLYKAKNLVGLLALRRPTTIVTLVVFPEQPSKGSDFYWKCDPSTFCVTLEIQSRHLRLIDCYAVTVKPDRLQTVDFARQEYDATSRPDWSGFTPEKVKSCARFSSWSPTRVRYTLIPARRDRLTTGGPAMVSLD